MDAKNIRRREFLKISALSTVALLPAAAMFSGFVDKEASEQLIIDCGFRLTDYRNLLNLEFYFINLEYRKRGLFQRKGLTARFGQQEAYMIVRLPQQHIAEQALSIIDNDFSVLDKFTAVTKISGYSYLVFRIIFSGGADEIRIPLSAKRLMDWNNEFTGNGYMFKLVVRQNLNTSLFELKTKNLTGGEKVENRYPLGYAAKDVNGKPEYTYDYGAYPKVAGDPVTAIEAPWRILLSPKLPDQDRFKFKWTFAKPVEKTGTGGQYVDTRNGTVRTLSADKFTAELWMAALTIEEDEQYLKQQIRRQLQNKQPEGNVRNTAAEKIYPAMEVMLLGSPDYPDKQASADALFKNKEAVGGFPGAMYKVLPEAKDRHDLVDLYIKYKLLANADKLSFSALGISAEIGLKNEKIDSTLKAGNDLYSWKQLISFGRDEEVEVVRLILEKEFGHKYLHISTTKRRLRRGIAYLDYREYIMPLDLTINYEQHESEKNILTGEINTSKFQSPFRQIEIKERQPKRIIPVNQMADDLAGFKFTIPAYDYKDPADPNNIRRITGETNSLYYPVSEATREPVTFEYEGVDWEGQKVKFNKVIQAIPASINNALNAITPDKLKIADIDQFFEGGKLSKLQERITGLATYIEAGSDNVNVKKQWIIYRDRCRDLLNVTESRFLQDISRIAKNSNFFIKELPGVFRQLKQLSDGLNEIGELNLRDILSEPELEKRTQAEKDRILQDFNDLKRRVKLICDLSDQTALLTADTLDNALNQLTGLTGFIADRSDLALAVTRTKLLHAIERSAEVLSDVVKKGKLLINGIENPADLPEILAAVQGLPKIDDVKKIIEKEILNTINITQQQVAFTARSVGNDLDLVKKDSISNLRTESLLFRGKIAEAANGIDLFNRYAALPQLQRASTYIKSLDKLIGEEISVNFRYARDYINNQADTTRLETVKNASMVFAEVTEASRDYLKGQMRKVAADMGGYINPELPVEYLTYLKDPKKLKDSLGTALKNNIPPELKEVYDDASGAYNDLVFISGQAKDAWNSVRNIKPEDFFAGLDAKILGSIYLKDILGLDFEMPRLSIIPNKKGLPDKVVYNFLTDKIKEKDIGVVKFYAMNKGRKAAFQIYMEKGIQDARACRSFTRLENFSIGIKPFGPEILTILFNKLEVASGSAAAKKTTVDIADIKFGGPLDFIGKLAESLHIPGTGLHINPSFREIEIGYSYTLPGIETPAFNLANLKFDIAFTIPLPDSSKKNVEELSTTFSINRPEDKFLVTAGIFGGRGHCVIRATPTKIKEIDTAIEYGGYFGINLGIAKGYVYLFAGLRYEARDGDIKLTAYIICSGGVTVFGFISVSVTFLLLLQYNIQSNVLFGSASVSYSIKIGFFKKSFTLRYSKQLTGSKGKKIDPNVEQQAYAGDFVREEVFYASTGNAMENIPAAMLDSPAPAHDVEHTGFNEIYTRGIYLIYHQSFNRNSK